MPSGLAKRSSGVRLLVLSAGSLMNLLLPLLLFSIALMVPHDLLVGKAVVEEVAPNSPANMSGIEAGDTIITINENPVQNLGDLRYIHLNLGKEINILVQHSDLTKEEIKVIPRWNPPEGEGAIGVAVSIQGQRLSASQSHSGERYRWG